MTILLYLLLSLLVLSLAALDLTFLGPPRLGPEGPVGVWLVFVPSLVLALLFLLIGSQSERFAWMLPNRFVWLLITAGVMVCLGVALFSLLDRGSTRWLAMATTAVIGAACVLAMFPGSTTQAGTRRIVALVLFGLPALAGYAVLIGSFVSSAIQSSERRAADEQAIQEGERKRDQWDIDNFAALPVDAPFFAVSQFLWSPNESVKARARARLKERPNLQQQMIDCLAIDGCDETVASYLAYIEEHPSPALAPAYAAFLDRQLASWKSTRLIGPNPAQWEPNLSSWFDAAERLQAAGGNLRPSLQAWRDALAPISGFNGLVRRIDDIR